MDTEIRKLYETIISSENFKKDSIDEELRNEIKNFLKEQCGDLNTERMECIAFSLAEIGQEAGFVRGFKYAFQLAAECIAK